MVGIPHLTGKQKIYTAVVILVCEPGAIEKRLESAYHSAIASVDPQLDLPPELVKEFVQIRDELRKEFVFPSASSSSEAERRRWAARLATRIVAFYDILARTK
ncbi:MAG: hypothetical protein ACJ8J7_08625 [Sulfurifustaceae bacterium]